MQMFESTIDGLEVILLYQGEDRPVHLYVRVIAFDLVRIDEEFPNPVVASAFLRAELTYQDARQFLEMHGVPTSSQLWHLNHDGPPETR